MNNQTQNETHKGGENPAQTDVEEGENLLRKADRAVQMKGGFQIRGQRLGQIEQGGDAGESRDADIDSPVMMEQIPEQCQQNQGDSQRGQEQQQRQGIADDLGQTEIGDQEGKYGKYHRPGAVGKSLGEHAGESVRAAGDETNGGFQAGAATTVGNTGATEGGAIGKNAKETNGGFAGGAGANASYGGVIGKRAAEKNGGGAAGLDTYANAGGAVGSGAVAGSGFSGGKGAKAAPIDESKGTYIDAVQLGTGTNEVPGSLQVYEFQLMDGSGKIPVERLPETVTNSNWGGVVSSWAGLPSTPKLGMYCYVSSDIANGEKYTGKASDMFFSMSNEYPSEILPLGPIKFTAPENCIEPYGTSFAEGYVCVYTENGSKIGKLVYNPTGLPDFIRGEELGLTSMDDTVTFYLGYWDGTNFPAKIEKFSAGSMIFWNGTKWCGVASSDTVGEIETALDGILSIQNALIGGGSE